METIKELLQQLDAKEKALEMDNASYFSLNNPENPFNEMNGQEYESVKEAINDKLYCEQDATMKKILMMAKVAAEGIDGQDAISMASFADDAYTRYKTFYKAASGEFELSEAVEKLIDHTAAKLVVIVPKAIEQGLPIVADKIATAVEVAFPKARVVAPYIRMVGRVVAPRIAEAIKDVIPQVAETAKGFARKAISTIGEIVKEKKKQWGLA